MEQNKTYDLSEIFIYLWRKRKILIIATILGAIVSIIFSLLMPNRFKAETVIFPTSFLAGSTMNLSVNQETDPLKIGNEDDLEKTIQILRSDVITDRIISKYGLTKHYNINDANRYKKSMVKNKFKKNVSYNKTTYQGLVISVVDTDPKMASDIANNISGLLDSLVIDMQKQRAQEAYNIALKTYEAENQLLKKFEDSMDMYRQLGLLDFHKDADRYTEAYAKSLGKNTLTPAAKAIFDKKFEILRKYGSIWNSLQRKIDFTADNATRYHIKLVQLEQNLKQPLTRKFIISPAQIPDRKIAPKRSVIVLFSTLGAFLFAVVIIFTLDYINELKRKLN
ncbi:MAG: Wzz/FepE/Etk N-terminal domain-containing protein [Deltaproteobacteria bacterium]